MLLVIEEVAMFENIDGVKEENTMIFLMICSCTCTYTAERRRPVVEIRTPARETLNWAVCLCVYNAVFFCVQIKLLLRLDVFCHNKSVCALVLNRKRLIENKIVHSNLDSGSLHSIFLTILTQFPCLN